MNTAFKAEVFPPKKKILKNKLKKLKYIPFIFASLWNSLHIILIYITFLILDSLDFGLLIFKC